MKDAVIARLAKNQTSWSPRQNGRFLSPDQTTAQAEITLLHNIALSAQVERLARALQARAPESEGTLRRFARLVEEEWRDGGWAGRRRLMLRVLRSLAYRLFRIRVLPHLPAASSDAPLAAALPGQYARLDDALQAWRCTPMAEAQRAGATPYHAAMRQAAQQCWERFVAAHAEFPFLAELKPHNGQQGKLRVLVLLGGGGLGDALLFSAVLGALWRRLAPCEIVLLYEKQVVVPLYAGNPTVACALAAPWGELQDVAKAARWLGIFDLVVDVYCFLPRYLVCEGSRIDMDRHGMWLAGNEQIADLIDRFSSNLGVSLLDRAFHTHVLDILASITGLPINAATPLIFSPDPTALARVRAFALPSRYVTIRDGSNPGDMAFARSLGVERTTKQLPLSKWAEILALLRAHGLRIVQVGDTSDPPAIDADIDLRGRTNLSELCFVMKGAVAHIDTEGGLVHFARAVHVPAVVFFGTTSKAFFGYPTNLNLDSPLCGRCWYSNATWLAYCPRGTEGPECTASIDLEPLRQCLPALIAAREQSLPQVLARALFGEVPVMLPMQGASLAAWGEAMARHWAAQHLRDLPIPPRLGVITPAPGRSAPPGLVQLIAEGTVVLGSIYNMPVNSGAFDALVCVEALTMASEGAAALNDLLRLVGRDGLLVIATSLPVKPPAPSADLDPSAWPECLGDAARFDPDAIAASAAAVARAGFGKDIAWACFCLSRSHFGMAENAQVFAETTELD
ncbi:MAG: hypothetical protein K6U10_14720 [Acidobacteriia bacterium]|nr:hypothetical protein [Methyloceanibacter sp.]MCL6493055.1 hypothetical protein [Terriglobia bacterium]